MRRLIVAFVVLSLFSALLAIHAAPAVSASPLTLINLTKDRALQNSPTIGWTPSGDLIVAWVQTFSTGRVTQTDIVSRIQHAGSFGSVQNISNDRALSRQPSIFSFGQFGSVLYQEVSNGASLIARSDWSGAGWASSQVLTGGKDALLQDPVGVQASDGSVWIARWLRQGPKRFIILEQLGGPSFIITKGGNVTRYPSLVAGDNGEVYISWVDHTTQPAGYWPGIRVARVTSLGVTPLPQPTLDYYAYWPEIAYRGGQLYAAWDATSVDLVRTRVWNGSAWGQGRTLGTGGGARIAVTPGKNVYVVWHNNGQIYLQKNSDAPQIISGTLTNASQPALTVDDLENAHVVFSARGDIWYAMVPGQ